MAVREIEVTRECIEQGVRDKCQRCPVALAIRKHLRQGVKVSVGNELAVFSEHPVRLSEEHWFPHEACEFIGRFDRGLVPVQPFTFRMTVPDWALA